MHDDGRRWFTLVVVVTSVIIVAMDNTILSVAIPRIGADLGASLASLQWVVTGYSLTLATLMIIGGRLGDVYGPRRTFIVGAGTFAAGSLLASAATSVPVLVVGEAVIEGIGASLMMPATLAILSNTFTGRDRARAFGVWGATTGLALVIGPAVGGLLTTNFSWRWAFRINVIIGPLAMLGAAIAFSHDRRGGRRQRIDVPGAVLVALGCLLLVFGISEGARYGWWRPIGSLSLGGVELWPADRPLSIVPFAFVASAVLLGAFIVVERARGRRDADPLFEMDLLRFRTFRFGLVASVMLAMGQLGYLFSVPIFLQEGRHLSAQSAGLWLVPSGIVIIIGAQVSGRLATRIGPTPVVRVGLVCEAVGLFILGSELSAAVTQLGMLPGLAVFSLGVGLASSQLTNVVLSEITPEHAGAASGANTTMRQIGGALGVAIVGTVLATASSPASGARTALFVASVEVALGTLLSFRIPRVGPPAHYEPDDERAELVAETLVLSEPL